VINLFKMTGETGYSDKPKKKWSDSERSELMKKMDEDLEKHFAELEARAAARGPLGKNPEGWTEENWEEEMQQHPFFNTGWKEGEELSPLMQGLQDLKYSPDENTPEELAKNYKEDGNFNFKCKKYRFAVASYTEGLKTKCGVREVETQLLTNRAAAQFHIGNYRSSLNDCGAALVLTPDHLKAVVRGALCHARLGRHREAVAWCDRGLSLEEGHKELLPLRTECLNKAKEIERNERKRAAAEKRKKEEEEAVLRAVKERGVQVDVRGKGDVLSMEALEPLHPAAVQRRVKLTPTGELVWPVLFLYPEFGETDFIEEFNETELFSQHLEVMFGPDTERPGWDQGGRYTPPQLQLFFEDKDQQLVRLGHDCSLATAVTTKGFLLKGGTPAFIILVKECKFTTDFLSKYTVIR